MASFFKLFLVVVTMIANLGSISDAYGNKHFEPKEAICTGRCKMSSDCKQICANAGYGSRGGLCGTIASNPNLCCICFAQ
ncbi:unnamed protein product [Cuscuta epithymum]|uniref:Uncharacterized protein n=1 Tax=Cuscuta epithymum TaxID=186058 RepID=A0AAV0CQ55_9ASTE|nr:unnamed protein product [Cuscuta epithymum]